MAKSPFTVNWTCREDVIAYAKSLGRGQVVFKSPQRPNYNITHAERFFAPGAPYKANWLVFTTTD